jgi:hypothetical protein
MFIFHNFIKFLLRLSDMTFYDAKSRIKFEATKFFQLLKLSDNSLPTSSNDFKAISKLNFSSRKRLNERSASPRRVRTRSANQEEKVKMEKNKKPTLKFTRTHTHTHTHAQREGGRERERGRNRERGGGILSPSLSVIFFKFGSTSLLSNSPSPPAFNFSRLKMEEWSGERAILSNDF